MSQLTLDWSHRVHSLIHSKTLSSNQPYPDAGDTAVNKSRGSVLTKLTVSCLLKYTTLSADFFSFSQLFNNTMKAAPPYFREHPGIFYY